MKNEQQEMNDKLKKQENFKRLMALVKPHKFTLFWAVCFMFVAAATTGCLAYAVQPLLDDVFINKNQNMLNILPFIIFALSTAKGLATFFQAYLMNYVGFTIVNNLRVTLYSHMQNLSLGFFHKNSTGQLISRVVNDVSLIQGSVTSVITSLILDFFTVLCLLAVLLYRDPFLTLFAFLILPLAFYPVVRFARRLRRLATDSQVIMGGLISILTESFQGIRVVQAYNMTDYEIGRFAKECKKSVDNLLRSAKIKAFNSPLMETLGGVCIAFIVWYGGTAVINGKSTAGSFVSFLTALLLLYEPLKRLTKLYNEVQQGLSASQRIFEVLDLESDVKENENFINLEQVNGEIEFKNVNFCYEGRNKDALKNINLRIKKGEMLAIVGASGGGKTTLVNLLPRFYDVNGGSILIDGQNIKNFSLESLRKQIALVSQEIILFNDSVKHNIAYGNLNIEDEKIKKAAKAALADGFIKKMPNAYETNIGEGGNKLSGGQKQRLAIARAILKDAPILILDEATSALDTESEKYVQEALDNLMFGRTTLVIAHRLSTIRNANRIIVLVNGEIVEEGNHEELLAKNGEYNKLYQLQFKEQVKE